MQLLKGVPTTTQSSLIMVTIYRHKSLSEEFRGTVLSLAVMIMLMFEICLLLVYFQCALLLLHNFSMRPNCFITSANSKERTAIILTNFSLSSLDCAPKFESSPVFIYKVWIPLRRRLTTRVSPLGV